MKILMITRLMSGFIRSVKKGQWQPTGAPAIYRMINQLDKSADLNIIFTLKASETIDKKWLNCPLTLEGLSVKPIIIDGPNSLPKLLGSLNTYLAELRQAWYVYRSVKKLKPDIVYIDRVNVLLGAVIARFTRIPVHLRLLGTPPSLQTLMTKPALSHYLYRWAYRSPFKMVLCSRDGSPGKIWMQRALKTSVPRKCWLNGVDTIVGSRKATTIIRLVLIGRLNYLKRIDQAVEAILKLPQHCLNKIHVDIIGDGELFGSIQQKINNSKQFTLHGAIPHEVVLQKLLQSDILISLNTHGNLTNTVLEAIRCGLCLILPQPDTQSAIDIDTFTLIPNDSVIQLSRANLLTDLTKQLQRLIENTSLITLYQQKTQRLSEKIETWDERIAREVQLLKPYDRVIVISDLRGGGTQKVLERLLKQWVLQGKRLAIVTLDIPENDKIQLPDQIDRITLGGIGDSNNSVIGVIANLRRLINIRRAIKRLNSPIVISFLGAINILTVLATRGLPCRLIISERNDPARQSLGRIWDILRKKCYRYADVVTANSYSAIKTMTAFVDQEKCHYVPNPIVLPETISTINLGKPTIVAVGRLYQQKAYDVLIRAFDLFYKQFPHWQLVILGEGPLRPALEKQIKQLQLQQVIKFVGYVNPFPYLAAAEIYTMPSRYEGMPNALLEAMAMAKPVVISDALTGPLDFIQDHENALVVPVEKAEALATAFVELENHPELRQHLAQQAKQSVAAFAMESVLPQWEVLFNA